MYTSGGSHRLRELPAQAAGPPEADPATPAGPVPPLLPAGPTEVDPAPGRCQCCQSKQLGAYWGLRAGGWGPGAGGGLGLGGGLGAGRWAGTERGWGWGPGLGLQAGGPNHVLQLLHELFHLLLAVRAEAACAIAMKVEAAGPAETDPATLPGPAPPLLPVSSWANRGKS